MDNSICIGVVIVNYNSTKYLVKALNALSLQNYKPHEIIIFDNNSTETPPENLATMAENIKIIKSTENIGFAAGNNAAIKCLSPEVNWIALLNPDAYPEKNWLSEMVNHIQNAPEYGFWGSKLICETEPNLLDGTGDAYHISGKAWRMNFRKPLINAPMHKQEIFSPCAAAALYQKEAFIDAEGFDESYFCYYEDIDLAFRLRLLGYKGCYAPTAIAYHTGSATTKRHSDFYTYHGHRNLVWTYFKNMPTLLLILFLPLHLLLNIVTVLLFARHGQLKIILKSKLDAVKHFKIIFQKRYKLQKKRVISNWSLLKLMNKGLPW